MRILLIEDDELNIELFTAVLEGDGHGVTIERDGATARTAALSAAFDLIIVDIRLPHLRGDAVCRELRASGVRVPIVALSAEALPEQIRANGAAGFDAYLTKPISTKTLRDAVLRYAAGGAG